MLQFEENFGKSKGSKNRIELLSINRFSIYRHNPAVLEVVLCKTVRIG